MMNNVMSNFVCDGPDACRIAQSDNANLAAGLASRLREGEHDLAAIHHHFLASRGLIHPVVDLATTVERELWHRHLKRLAHSANQPFGSIGLN